MTTWEGAHIPLHPQQYLGHPDQPCPPPSFHQLQPKAGLPDKQRKKKKNTQGVPAINAARKEDKLQYDEELAKAGRTGLLRCSTSTIWYLTVLLLLLSTPSIGMACSGMLVTRRYSAIHLPWNHCTSTQRSCSACPEQDTATARHISCCDDLRSHTKTLACPEQPWPLYT